QYTTARAHFEQSLALFREMDDRRSIALALANLATVASNEGDYVLACDYHRETLPLFREQRVWQDLAIGLNNLADTLLRMGEAGQVPPLLVESLALCREIGSRSDMLHCLYNCMSL